MNTHGKITALSAHTCNIMNRINKKSKSEYIATAHWVTIDIQLLSKAKKAREDIPDNVNESLYISSFFLIFSS